MAGTSGSGGRLGVRIGGPEVSSNSRDAGTIQPVFRANFYTGSTTPQTGTAGTFARASSETFYDTFTSLATKTSGNACIPAFPLNGSGTRGGLYCGGARKNFVLQSEAPGTTWTAVGSPTITNDVGTFLGTISYGTIAPAAANEGIEQAISLASASNTVVCSVYMSCDSGTVPVTITIEGDSGGTPETTTKQVTVTTTPQRFDHVKTFSGSATGNAKFKITIDDTSTLRLGGMQVEHTNASTFHTNMIKPSAYIKTTTAAATTVKDNLFYTGAEIAALSSKFTIMMWINVSWTQADLLNNAYKLIWGEHNNALPGAIIYNHGGVDKLVFELNTAATKFMRYTLSITRNVWFHLTFVADYEAGTFSVYKNAVALSLDSDSSAGVTAPTITGLQFGGDAFSFGDGRTCLDGLIDEVLVFNNTLVPSEILYYYNAANPSVTKGV